jgi:hypothetical protein
MSSELQTNVPARRPEQSSRWAPWWIYALGIVPANLGKEQLLPGDAAWWLRAALTAAIVAAGVAVVTAIYRAGRDARVPWNGWRGRDPVLIALIVAAEVAFWLVLLAGLVTRYGLRRPRLGMALLAATPFVDLGLIAATAIDLRRGGEAAFPHALLRGGETRRARWATIAVPVTLLASASLVIRRATRRTANSASSSSWVQGRATAGCCST